MRGKERKKDGGEDKVSQTAGVWFNQLAPWLVMVGWCTNTVSKLVEKMGRGVLPV